MSLGFDERLRQQQGEFALILLFMCLLSDACPQVTSHLNAKVSFKITWFTGACWWTDWKKKKERKKGQWHVKPDRQCRKSERREECDKRCIKNESGPLCPLHRSMWCGSSEVTVAFVGTINDLSIRENWIQDDLLEGKSQSRSQLDISEWSDSLHAHLHCIFNTAWRPIHKLRTPTNTKTMWFFIFYWAADDNFSLYMITSLDQNTAFCRWVGRCVGGEKINALATSGLRGNHKAGLPLITYAVSTFSIMLPDVERSINKFCSLRTGSCLINDRLNWIKGPAFETNQPLTEWKREK